MGPDRSGTLERVRGPELRRHAPVAAALRGAPSVRVEGSFAAKRAMDVIVGSALAAVSAPVLLLLAIAIRLDSSGSALYRQRRVGLGGREFGTWKLRTMERDAEAREHEVRHLDHHASDGRHFKIRRDPRVTRVGRFLRRFSLDELPQLWNVVAGDMSLVGPRPPIPREVARYGPRERVRLSVPAGLTGLWQVSGRAELTFERCVQLDRIYVARRSLLLDLWILSRTVWAVLGGRGAY